MERAVTITPVHSPSVDEYRRQLAAMPGLTVEQAERAAAAFRRQLAERKR